MLRYLLVALCLSSVVPASAGSPPPRLWFEPNRGQAPADIRFAARDGERAFLFSSRDLTIAEHGRAALTLRPAGAARAVEPRAAGPTSGVTNYCFGNDSARWQTGVPNYSRVEYPAIYPGIDLVYYGSAGRLEYDFLVAPGADPSAIRLAFGSPHTRLRLDASGDLLLRSPAGEFRIARPRAFQRRGDREEEIAASYLVGSGRVSFRLGKYDRSLPLRIDPVFVWTVTNLPGAAFGVALDSAGNSYVVGHTDTTFVPALPAPKAVDHFFVTKLDRNGVNTLFTTYLGDQGTGSTGGVALDPQGNVWVAGSTSSTSFPLKNPLQGSIRGASDAFITQLDPAAGTVMFSTYLGGSGTETAAGIAVDPAGNAYVAGSTNSADFPVLNPISMPSLLGGSAFVTKIAASGANFAYSTYLGGGGNDQALAIAVDSAGSAYVTGSTTSSDFPQVNPLLPVPAAPAGFVTKISPAGDKLVYSSPLSGIGYSIAVDSHAAAYLLSLVRSAIPFFNDLVVNALTPAGNTLTYSTVLSNPSLPIANYTPGGIAADGASDVFVVGTAAASDFQQNTSVAAFELDPTGQQSFTAVSFTGRAPANLPAAAAVAVQPSAAAAVVAGSVCNTSQTPSCAGFVSKLATGVPITVNSGSSGCAVKVDGSAVPLPANLNWETGSTHTLAADPVQTSAGIRCAFRAWADGGPASRSITAGITAATYTANFDLAYLLSSNPVPAGSGTVSPDTASPDGYYPAGAVVTLTAVPAIGYRFAGWTAALSGTANPQPLTLSAPANVQATFSPLSQVPVTIGSIPSGLSVTVDSAPLVTPQVFGWIPSSTHSLSVASPQTMNGVRYLFRGWSNNAGQAQQYTVPSAAATLIAIFNPDNGAAVITAPAPGTVLATSAATFAWSGVAAATKYRLDVGISPFDNSLASQETTGTSLIVSGLPADGSIVFARLWTFANGTYSAWFDAIYTTSRYSGALRFIPITPCRLADTRKDNGSFGGPVLAAGATRIFPVPQGSCGIPASAQAYSLNATAVPQGPLGYLSLWPAGQLQPFVSTLNSNDGRVKANAAIVPAGSSGGIAAFATDATHLVLDVNGYFVPASAPSSLSFYPVAPCRVADTRYAPGALGGPVLGAGEARVFPVTASGCGIPSAAGAYSMNVTVVPQNTLNFLTVFPSGGYQPFVSTLNAPTGTVTANAAIIPAGAGGSISVYATDATDVIIDINGYFAPPGSAGALSFYSGAPCRLADTRLPAGALGGPSIAIGKSRSFPLQTACSVAAGVRAYSLNATVVPQQFLGYLTLWPSGLPTPLVSTLNAYDGAITSNAAIVPAGSDGSISAAATNPTDLILDINGYFAP